MNIDTLHEYAIRLKKLGLLQIAGDIDYLIAWLKSPEFNNGFHLPPHPAGENTYDEYSHHCPIPFIPCRTILKRFVNNCEALNLIGSAKDIITELLSEYSSDLEQTAIHAYIDYTDNLINILSDEESDPPIPPAHNVVYINTTSLSAGETSWPVYSNSDHTQPIYYDVTKLYTITGWYDSSDTWHDNNGELTLDRRSKSGVHEAGDLLVKNVSNAAIDIVSFEYTTSASNRLQACFSEDIMEPDGSIDIRVNIAPGEYAIACAPVYDYEDSDGSTANIIIYEDYTAYTCIRYRDGSSGAFKTFNEGDLTLSREYIPALDIFALAIHNNTDSSISIKDFEYTKTAIHVLNIVAPDIASGESCSINAMYNGTFVNPQWTISPEGPTISNGILSFSDSGIYTLSASYNGLNITKQIELEYKDGWSTETIIDDTGDYPVANTTITDESGNKESEIVAYIDGEPVNTGFELEPGNEDMPITIDEGKDTKIYTFDGTNGFELFFKFHYDPSLQPSPDYTDKPDETDTVKHYTMLNMKYEVPPYPGIAIRHDSGATYIKVSITPINPSDPGNATVAVQFPLTEDGIYDMYMRYEPSAPFEKFVIVDNRTGNVKSKFEHYTYEFSNNVTATLGYVNAGTFEDPIPCRQCLFDVYDFRLNKIMNPWKDVPIITETTTHNGLLITKEITNDESHIVKRLLIEPDPNTSSDEYTLLDDGLVFDDILPFVDSDQVFELEFDVKVSYEDQIPYNGQYQVLVNMIPEIQNHWPGFCVRLASEARPSSTRPNGAVDFRLRYTNDRNVYNNSLKANALFDIDEDHIMHYRYIYEGTAIRKCSALYSYKTDTYRIFTGNALYAVYPHDWPLCIGCALDENRQKSRVCKMYVKKIEYIRNLR